MRNLVAQVISREEVMQLTAQMEEPERSNLIEKLELFSRSTEHYLFGLLLIPRPDLDPDTMRPWPCG